MAAGDDARARFPAPRAFNDLIDGQTSAAPKTSPAPARSGHRPRSHDVGHFARRTQPTNQSKRPVALHKHVGHFCDGFAPALREQAGLRSHHPRARAASPTIAASALLPRRANPRRSRAGRASSRRTSSSCSRRSAAPASSLPGPSTRARSTPNPVAGTRSTRSSTSTGSTTARASRTSTRSRSCPTTSSSRATSAPRTS